MPSPLGLVCAGILLAGIAVTVWLRSRARRLDAFHRAYVQSRQAQAGWVEPSFADEVEAFLREVAS